MNQNENIISDEDKPVDDDTSSQRLQASITLNNVYAKSFILERELSSAETQTAVSTNCEKLQFAFNKC